MQGTCIGTTCIQTVLRSMVARQIPKRGAGNVMNRPGIRECTTKRNRIGTHAVERNYVI